MWIAGCRVEVATGYLSGLIEAYFGDGTRWGVAIRYHQERERAGTAGPIALFSDVLDETFLIMNGDVLTDLDFARFYEDHRASGALLTAATCQRTYPIAYGTVVRGESGRIVDYIEKPTYTYECSAGIYMANRRIVSAIKRGVPDDFPDLVKRLLAADEKVLAYAIPGFWYDIGTPADHRMINEEFARLFPALVNV